MLESQLYLGKDLGLTYHPSESKFKVWSPQAKSVRVKLYDSGNAEENNLRFTMSMEKSQGVWSTTIRGDLAGLFYTYEICHGDQLIVETNDIYAKAVGLNGERAAIIDMSSTNPVDWDKDHPVAQKSITDAYIWEVHVADFSSDPASGISEAHRGKYLAFTESNTTLNGDGIHPTGVHYLKELGVNYVHLLPAYDTDNDELGTDYNWGYNPKNYNVPEGRYATNPHDPKSRIKEFKQMVQHVHQAGMGVVLDVVYNHTSVTEHSWFNLTVPNYYYRQRAEGGFADGSACGNEVASDRFMVREYIVESVLHWAKEYHLDGFRFDLMGLHDVVTMNAIRHRLNEEGYHHVILYGEPWDAGTNEIKLPHLAANKKNTDQFDDGIAIFNDDLRDAVKGYVFEETEGAFVQGKIGETKGKHPYQTTFDLQAGLTANTRRDLAKNTQYAPKDWARSPKQVISYVSAHDNLTLWDKLVLSTKNVQGKEDYKKDDRVLRMNQLAATLLFMSQGGIFTQAGEEFARTKFGDENSYVSPIGINQLNWSQTQEFKGLVSYYRGLWEIRQAYAPLRDSTCLTSAHICFSKTENPNVLAYTIPNLVNHQGWTQLAVIVNSSETSEEVQLESTLDLPDTWYCLADNQGASATPRYQVDTKGLIVPAQSSFILAH